MTVFFHTIEDTKRPTKGWRKGEIVEWLVGKGEDMDLTPFTIPELLQRSKRYAVPKEFIVSSNCLAINK